MPAWRAVLCGVVLLVACRREATAPSAHMEIAALSDGSVVVARGGRLVNIQRDGIVGWDLLLPRRDQIVAPISNTVEGAVFARGARTLYAIKQGEIVWRQPVAAVPPGADARLYAPMLADHHAAVMMTEPGRFVVFRRKNGEVVWEVRVPDKAQIIAPAVVTSRFSLIIPTSAGFYGVEADGSLDWHEVL